MHIHLYWRVFLLLEEIFEKGKVNKNNANHMNTNLHRTVFRNNVGLPVGNTGSVCLHNGVLGTFNLSYAP